jgi:enoyl-CoA hydratase
MEDEHRPYCLYEVDRTKGIARITLNRPERLNSALDSEWREIVETQSKAVKDPDVKVIIYKGAGRCFGTGHNAGDIIARDTLKPGEKPRSIGQRITRLRGRVYGRRGWNQSVHNCPKVTIAQVHGYCYGGHFQMVSGCDFIIASEDATFTHPGYRYIGPMGEDMLLLIMKMGVTKLKEMMFTGRALDAREALECGLITKVVPFDALEEETNKMADLITLQAADSLIIGKANFNTALAIAGKQAVASAGTIGHVWQHMMRSEPDEFNLVRLGRERGLKGALMANKQRWKDNPIARPQTVR